MNIEWKDSYCVGEEVIDREHQELFALANAVHIARDQAALRLCAMQLYKHVREHFSHEEELMKKIGFPATREHIASHFAMVSRLNGLSAGIGRNQIDTEAVTRFMNEWALHHIPTEDAQFAAYIKSHHASNN